MKENKKKLVPLIDTLHRLKHKDLIHVLKHLKKDEIDLICECVYNVIKTPLKLSKQKKCNLKRYLKKHCCIKRLETISNKKVNFERRRKALQQEGKGLGMILATALPFLVNLFSPKKAE
jgi:hypothetical protein